VGNTPLGMSPVGVETLAHCEGNREVEIDALIKTSLESGNSRGSSDLTPVDCEVMWSSCWTVISTPLT